MTLRPYQRRAVNGVFRLWHEGVKRVCLVSVTGSGKSVMAAEAVRRARAAGARVLAVAHRRELVEQLCDHFGPEAAPVCAGMDGDPSKPIQAASIQTLMARDTAIECELVVADECHHLPQGGQWVHVLEQYATKRWLGLTATPERADGQALGDTFERMVVAAQYSELIEAGHIVPCDVYHPPQQLQGGQAMLPVEAYQKYGENRQAFVFVGSVDEAFSTTLSMQAAGINAAVVTGETEQDLRKSIIDSFKNGSVRVLVNVYCLTEGFDAPTASVCILGRGFGHASTYLQCVGRVLRPSPGKTRATLIDLTGAVLAHGLPTSDREYSLEGRAIGVAATGRALRVCLECGYTFLTQPECPRCGFVATPKNKVPRIYSVDLQHVYAGAATEDSAKSRELRRLRAVAKAKSWAPSWVIKQYRELFGEAPPGYAFDESERRREWESLTGLARQRGYAKGYAFARFKAAFGCNPPWGW